MSSSQLFLHPRGPHKSGTTMCRNSETNEEDRRDRPPQQEQMSFLQPGSHLLHPSFHAFKYISGHTYSTLECFKSSTGLDCIPPLMSMKLAQIIVEICTYRCSLLKKRNHCVDFALACSWVSVSNFSMLLKFNANMM